MWQAENVQSFLVFFSPAYQKCKKKQQKKIKRLEASIFLSLLITKFRPFCRE